MKSAVERRTEILDIVNRDGKARVDELSDLFDVSLVTIRCDLTFLEGKGHIIRSHGAAISKVGVIAELSVQDKCRQNVEAKSKIGAAAVKLIANGDSIIIDSGSTSKEIAASLGGVDNVVVMTNGLDIATTLAEVDGIEVLMTGGSLRKNALSFSGSQAEQGLNNYCFDKLFLGVDGFDLRAGITTHNAQEASLNRLMCDSSEQVIAVADSSKFGRRSCHMIRAFGDIDVLITDTGIPSEYVDKLRSMQVEVIIVDNDA